MINELEDLVQYLDVLRDQLRIGVIFGGNKEEPGAVIYKTRSSRGTKTYEAVAREIADALFTLGFHQVHLYPEDMRLADRLLHDRIDLCWLNSGGVQGLNPMAHLPALMESLGLPYVGHNPLATLTMHFVFIWVIVFMIFTGFAG